MKGKIIKLVIKHKFIYNLLVLLYTLPRTIYYHLFLLFFSIFKVNNKKIIIISYSGKGYGDMGKYICNELIKYDYDIYRATREQYIKTLPEKINYVKYNSIKYLYHLATAKIWINNSRFPYGIRKRKKQFYIQVWHACLSLKRVESAVEKKLSKYYVMGAKNDSKMANLFVSNSNYCTKFYKKFFRYKGEILECGCPRNDIIINDNKDSVQKVRKYFGFSDLDKICLYAPTFRVDSSLDAYNIEYDKLIIELENKFKCKRKILIRLHPNISHLANQLHILNTNIVNSTDYPDMQELLVATDFLITDYSSCILDYALSGKPAMIYASDIDEYKKDRDFEIKLGDVPYPLATNNVELVNVIRNYDNKESKNNLNIFYDYVGLKESGKSCKELAKIINRVTVGK